MTMNKKMDRPNPHLEGDAGVPLDSYNKMPGNVLYLYPKLGVSY